VIANYAGMLAGADVSTQDVDITPSTAPENLERLASALAELKAGIRVEGEPLVPLPADARLLASAEIWNLTTRTATSTSPPAPAAQAATRISTAQPARHRSATACRSPSPPSKT